jgi:hypothetical protein
LTNHPQAPDVTAPKLEGMAITALVLAIIAVLFSWVPALGIIFGFVGLIAALLGVAGVLASTRKVMSGVAIGIGAVAVVVAIVVTAALGAAVDRAVTPGAVSGGTASAAAPTSAPDQSGEVATWGKTYTWGDGVAITVQAPRPCTSLRGGGRMIKITTEIVNNGKEPLTTALLAFGDAQFEGVAVSSKFEFEGDCKSDNLNSTTVLPGNKFTFTTTYGVGDQPGTLQLVYQKGLLDAKAVFVGQA